MADCDLKMSRTAKALNYHHNSIAHQLDKIYLKTGLDPRRFRDIVKLMGVTLPERNEDDCDG